MLPIFQNSTISRENPSPLFISFQQSFKSTLVSHAVLWSLKDAREIYSVNLVLLKLDVVLGQVRVTQEEDAGKLVTVP